MRGTLADMEDAVATHAKAYHHGDLPTALLDAVDAIVREQGIAAVTLREAARRSGVSHAAPAHHFGDKAGLLTAYAVQGFLALRARLASAGHGVPHAGGQALTAIGLAYVGFAIEEPGRFTVMFRPEVVRASSPSYRGACDDAFAVLLDAVAALRADLAPDDPQLLQAATGAWSIVHGFAILWLDGNLDERITASPPEGAAAAAFGAFIATIVGAGVTDAASG